jgi:alpha-1,6-mannosyltransferase
MGDPYGMFDRQRVAVSLLVFAAVIFRSEVALFLLSIAGTLLALPFTHLNVLVDPFLISFAMALLISVPLDSYFWQKPLWPELWGFYFNAVLGSSTAWGVSPWYFYFTSALPRVLLNPLVYLLLIPTAWRKRRLPLGPTTTFLVVPSLLFVAIYSLQPHKEARFIFYVAPPLTAAAAVGAAMIFNRRNKTLLYRLKSYLIVLSVLASFAASIAMSLISSLNYPGGEALSYLRWRIEDVNLQKLPGYDLDPREVHVHADVLSCMTGVTLFGTSSSGTPVANSTLIGHTDTKPPRILLDKTEDPRRLSDPNFWLQFDYVLAEDPARVKGGDWDEVAVVEGYAGVEFLPPGRRGDLEKAEYKSRVFGKGRDVATLRDRVRAVTGGLWIGPRMEPRIHILRRVKGGRDGGKGVPA